MKLAARLDDVRPYAHAELERTIAAARTSGRDVISLASGNLDLPAPAFVIEELARAAHSQESHRYPAFTGLPDFRRAVADFYETRFDVHIDADTQVLPLIGSKDGIAHLPWSVIDPGDVALVPEPTYPVYAVATKLAGGRPVAVSLRNESSWFPELDAIPTAMADRAEIFWLNYPANPTGAVADLEQLEHAVAFAARHEILLCYDNVYSEITFDGFVAPSVLRVPGALDVAVEFGSFSKTFNMAGWRVGWLVGNPRVVEALGRLKTNIDSGVFTAVQRAAVRALSSGLPHLPELVRTYQRRRDLVVATFTAAGWSCAAPKGGISVWVKTPADESSTSCASRLLDETGVLVAPGAAYGAGGDGYVRVALAVPDQLLDDACARLRSALPLAAEAMQVSFRS
ncbi:aminotransferase class I/II-fold pyridoxal phosphate-dependent enzyme [Tenggerimyces flavus]|uniref:Aminotransferase n=1 Tax=Tenggerimyces flavus TaxID=1708749 RepID=A0ABV7YKQ9_9ACTN|nr:aminotransferase class I/II-fold pyridoxal phosphate-dependent enzyme [Tenggerimyces flavus]MBM7789590.1 LL-diaminopimelate aminotransferase [Tenggerimyces flavus]